MECDIRRDEARNRLYIRLKGLFSDEETTAAVHRIVEAMDGMEPGFVIVNDMSEFRPLSQAGLVQLRRCGVEAVKRGLRISVRVVGGSPTATRQFARASTEVGYTTSEVASLAEAEKVIEEIEREGR